MDISTIKTKLSEIHSLAVGYNARKQDFQKKVSELNSGIAQINAETLKLEGRIGALIDLIPKEEQKRIADWYNSLNSEKKTESKEEPKQEATEEVKTSEEAK